MLVKRLWRHSLLRQKCAAITIARWPDKMPRMSRPPATRRPNPHRPAHRARGMTDDRWPRGRALPAASMALQTHAVRPSRDLIKQTIRYVRFPPVASLD